jgi:predicted transcriptional regulator
MRTFAEALRVLGALEERIMEALWQARQPLSVRDVCGRLRGKPALAYTTVMTTMDRLYKKGLLAREKEGLAFLYSAAMSRDEVQRRIVEETVSGLLHKGAEPVLAAFVDTAASVDEENLARLERLIAERRKGGR